MTASLLKIAVQHIDARIGTYVSAAQIGPIGIGDKLLLS